MARIPLVYPKIPGSSSAPIASCIAFEKYDGTNVHWAWNRELGWHAFGMRRQRYDLDTSGIKQFHDNHRGFEDIVSLFDHVFRAKLDSIFATDPNYNDDNIVVFTEYFGENSFAGMHQGNDPKRLVLIDVQSERGMVSPFDFLEDFEDLDIARVVYRGKLTSKFAEDVRNGVYNVDEGVVCKGEDAGGNVWMVKIKTNAYMNRLKNSFQEKWESYWE